MYIVLLNSNTVPVMDTTTAQGSSLQLISPNDLSEKIQISDSIQKNIADSLKNLSATDIKDAITGQNTLVTDGLRELVQLAVGFLPKLLVAIIILWVGLKLAKMLKRTVIRSLDRRGVDASIKGFLSSLADLLLKAMIIIMAMDVMGIKATSFIALLGALGLAIGMALQGTLQNFAGGVIILLMKPFKVNDYIECGTYKGYIKEIRIFHTIMRPFNGRTIIIPNSELATKSLINHTKEPIIRLDVVVSVAYGTNLQNAKKVLWEVINNEPLILHQPNTPAIVVSNLGDNSVDLSLWLWSTVEDYWTLWSHIREDIYIAFNNAQIEIPFPQNTISQRQDTTSIPMESRTINKPMVNTEDEKMGKGE